MYSNSSSDVVSEKFLRFLQVWSGFVSLSGLLTNLLTIFAFVRTKSLRIFTYVYVVNLSVIDWIMCSIIVPLTAYGYSYRYGNEICCLIAYLRLSFMCTCIYSLASISLNRYIRICFSGDVYFRIFKKTTVGLTIFLSWIIPLLILSPPFFDFGEYGYNEKLGTCFVGSYKANVNTFRFALIFPDLLVIVPSVLVIFVVYAKIALAFFKSRRQVKASTSNAENSKKQMLIKNRLIIRNMLVIIITLILCWVPLIVALKLDYHGNVSASIQHFLLMVAHTNSAINFYIYAFMDRKLRSIYSKLICSARKERNVTTSIVTKINDLY